MKVSHPQVTQTPSLAENKKVKTDRRSCCFHATSGGSLEWQLKVWDSVTGLPRVVFFFFPIKSSCSNLTTLLENISARGFCNHIV